MPAVSWAPFNVPRAFQVLCYDRGQSEAITNGIVCRLPPYARKKDAFFMVFEMKPGSAIRLQIISLLCHFTCPSFQKKSMNSSRSIARSSPPSSEETTIIYRQNSLETHSIDPLLGAGPSRDSHIEKANASKSPTERSPSSSPIHLGTLNPQVHKLDDQPEYPYPEPLPPLVAAPPASTPNSISPNRLQRPPSLEFAHPAGFDHREEPEFPASEGLYPEASTNAGVPLSELWDEVPPDFPQQVAVFLAQNAVQAIPEKHSPVTSNNKEETFTESKRTGKEQEEEEGGGGEVVTIQLDLNAEVAAALQTSILQLSTEEKLIASIKASRTLAEELQRLTVRSDVGDGLPSIDAVLQGTGSARELVFGLKLFREVP